MSIRFRLLLSFTSVVVVSVILFVLAAYLLSIAVTGDVRSFNSFYNIHYSLNPLSEEEENLFLDLKYIAKNDPGQLKDQTLLQEFDTRLKMVQAGLIVREDNSVIYSAASLNGLDLSTILPAYEMGNNSIRNTMNKGTRFFSYAKFDFYFSPETGERGSIYVFHERSPFAQVVRQMLPLLIGLFAAILLLTGWLLYRYVTRKIIQPLDRLRQSAELIKDGDLTFQLQSSSRDEVGQLVQTFDQMRQKLYDSIQLQLRYEDNRKQLLSNISHDLRTPITTIKGYAEGIRDGVTNTPEKLDRYVAAIHTRASDMERLVQELLYYSKLDLNKEPYSFIRLELSPFLHRIADELAIEFENNAVEVTWEEELGGPLFVLADAEKLKRVVMNLLDNSLKYMNQPPKRLNITIQRTDKQAVVIVADNGPGLEESSLSQIFERFYREEPSRSQAIVSGSGLGLAIAKQIIEGHGGSIWAESKPGSGLSVYFTLKLYEDRR
ncbi:HAMP domain-containing histidine kinase [Paenibacillus pasadenensis]|uniref:sensor histidine kinase n=1 Tax=Paenibacillus pasadenensis TaxID=217090 RepID=UPI00203E69EC|nr:HAMP domain-containing sensor histidine kinase [Paenibacillus pasadenensis]MCM3749390.1 HAMP domain-containing histidine kinase [Paenibacillus pasadenensis]